VDGLAREHPIHGQKIRTRYKEEIMNRHEYSLLLILCLVGLTGCVWTLSALEPAVRHNPAPIGTLAFEHPEFQTALEAVQHLRPTWRGLYGGPTGDGSDGLPVVYVRVRCGGYSCLRWLEAADVQEIEYVGPADATERWGVRHTNGVIDVRLGS